MKMAGRSSSAVGAVSRAEARRRRTGEGALCGTEPSKKRSSDHMGIELMVIVPYS
jgi:hypothetical protein